MKSIDIVQMNKDSYNKIATEFSASRAYIWEDMRRLVKYVKDGDFVLDVGCGNGRILEILKERNITYFGVDFSEGLIAEAMKAHSENDFMVADILNWSAEIGKYDAIFCSSVLNHFPSDLQQKALLNIKKGLKAGGVLLMINWNMWNIKSKKSIWRDWRSLLSGDVETTWQRGADKVALYYYAFTKRRLNKLLENCGFSVISNDYTNDGKKSCPLRGKNIVTVAKNIHPYLWKHSSPIQGVGIFTLKDIKAGEIFYEIPLKDLRYKNYKRYAYIGNGQYVCDENILNWLNHSCQPNMRIDIDRLDPVLIALNDINEGEEITCDYNNTEVNGVYRECNCQSSECRGNFGKKVV